MSVMIRRAIAVLWVAAGSRGQAQQVVAQHPSLRGQVQSPAGLPLPDAEVTVDGVKGSVRSDAQGIFLVPNVSKGIQTIRVRRIGYLPAVESATVPQGSDTLFVTLVPMHTELDTVRVRRTLNVLAGIVVDEHNRPIAGASVDLIGSRNGNTKTGDDGWFTFTSVRSGPVIFRAVKPGYVATTQSVQTRGLARRGDPNGDDRYHAVGFQARNFSRAPGIRRASSGPSRTRGWASVACSRSSSRRGTCALR